MTSRGRTGRILLALLGVATCLSAVLPLLIIFPQSLTAGERLTFPPQGFSLRWYEAFWVDPRWQESIWLSLRLAIATAVLATVVGGLTAFAIRRLRTRWISTTVQALVLTPLIVPTVIIGIGIFNFALTTNLRDTFLGLLLGHLVLTVPYCCLLIDNGLAHFDQELETVALTLGASSWQVKSRVTFRLLAPSFLGAAGFAFVLSWDEVIVSLLVGSVFNTTLPVMMLNFIETDFRPTIAVVSSLLILAVLAYFLARDGFVRIRKGAARRTRTELATKGDRP